MIGYFNYYCWQLIQTWEMLQQQYTVHSTQSTMRHVLKMWVCFKKVKCSKMKKIIIKKLRLSIYKGLIFNLLLSNWSLDYIKYNVAACFLFLSTWIKRYELLKNITLPILPKFVTQCQLWAKSRFRTCCTCNFIK